MRQIFGIALWEIKLAIRHTSFWLALIVLSVFDFMSSNLLHHSGTISYTSWGLAIWLSHRFLYIYLMLGLITIVIMRREQAERYDELIHSLPYSRYRFLLGRYLAVISSGVHSLRRSTWPPFCCSVLYGKRQSALPPTLASF